jgi:hypothetical protein
MLQAGKLRVYSDSNRNEYQKVFVGGIVRNADNFTPSVRRLSRQCGILSILQPNRPSLPVKGIAFTRIYIYIYIYSMYAEINLHKVAVGKPVWKKQFRGIRRR